MMKPLNVLLLLALGVTLLGCGSASREEPTAAPEADRDYDFEYKIIDSSEGDKPGWILNPFKADNGEEAKKNRYFVSEGSQRDKRLCLKSAGARASAEVAGEISQFIKNTYSEATQGDGDEDVSQYMQEQLTQEIQSFVVGARVGRKYWELRKYMKEMGASKDYKVYQCYVLVQIDKSNLNKAIEMARKKILSSISDSEVKKKTEEAIKDAEQKYDNLEKPVTLDDAA